MLNGTAHHSNRKFLESAPRVKLISCMQPKTKTRKHINFSFILLWYFSFHLSCYSQVKLPRYFNFTPHDFFLPLLDRINNGFAVKVHVSMNGWLRALYVYPLLTQSIARLCRGNRELKDDFHFNNYTVQLKYSYCTYIHFYERSYSISTHEHLKGWAEPVISATRAPHDTWGWSVVILVSYFRPPF